MTLFFEGSQLDAFRLTEGAGMLLMFVSVVRGTQRWGVRRSKQRPLSDKTKNRQFGEIVRFLGRWRKQIPIIYIYICFGRINFHEIEMPEHEPNQDFMCQRWTRCFHWSEGKPNGWITESFNYFMGWKIWNFRFKWVIFRFFDFLRFCTRSFFGDVEKPVTKLLFV